MGEMVSLIYVSMALMSRASMHQRGQLFGYSDMVRMAVITSQENISEFQYLFQQTGESPHQSSDKVMAHVHSRNLKYGGYFAFSPLDKNLY